MFLILEISTRIIKEAIMQKAVDLADRISKLQATKNILLTKGGSLNKGELAWIDHINKELSELNTTKVKELHYVKFI